MKQKRILALALAAAMIVPQCAVYADSVSSNGNSVVENDNSTAPKIQDVVLPTIAASTYDFTIDREHILSQYDATGKYDGSTVYFTAIGDPAYVTATKSGSEVEVYDLAKVETDASALLAIVKDKEDAAADTALGTSKIFVYGPTSSVNNTAANKGTGDYIQITDVATAKKYFTFTYDENNKIIGVDVRPDYNYEDDGASISTGVVYTEDYVLVDPTELANTDANVAKKYLTIADSLGADGQVGTDGILDTVTAIDPSAQLFCNVNDAWTALVAGDFTYIPATTVYTGESSAATIINKSTNPLMVKATVTLTKTDGLTFLKEEDTPVDTKANVWFSINAVGNSAFVENSTGTVSIGGVNRAQATGSATMLLPAAQYDVFKYQSKTTVSATGSHNYYQYVGPNAVFSSASFTIVGRADDTDSSATNKAWADYVESLESGAAVKPDVQVVYSFENAEEKYDSEGNLIGYVVNDAAKQAAVDNAQAAVDVAKAEVDKLQQAYNEAYAAYVTAKDADDLAQAKADEAAAALATAQAEKEAAEALATASGGSADPKYAAAVTAAQGKKDDADAAKGSTANALSGAETALTAAQTALTAAKAAYATELSNLTEAQAALTSTDYNNKEDSAEHYWE